MRIAITGSTGMIGIALAEAALNEGHEVIAFVRQGSDKRENLPVSDRLMITECDISNYKNIMGTEECDIFFHLAWDKTFGEGRDDTLTQLKNIGYTLDAVDLAKSWNASVFIGAGSQAEYGKKDEKLSGSTRTDPTSGYGIAKYSAGKLSRIRCEQLGLRHCWTRILSVYGEGDAPHTLISYLIDTLMKGDVPELTRCEQMWDYVYSNDAARALLMTGLHGKDGKTYCIGSGDCRPLKDHVCDVRDAVDPSLELKFGAKEYYPHQPMMLCADISELTEDTGFVPKYDFKEGIARTVRCVRDQKSISRKD
jgi:Nucleoside-diphosphate-sugar epimerases